MLIRSILLYISQNTPTAAVGLLRTSPAALIITGTVLAGFLPSVFAASSSLPVIQIQQPSVCSNRFTLGDIHVSGTAYSNTTQIAKVEALIEQAGSPSIFRFQAAIPESNGNWSHWSITLRPGETGPHRILAHVVDKSGAESWDEIIVQVNSNGLLSAPRQSGTRSVAVLEPMFTEAAYGSSDTELGNFYAFYFKYNSAQPGTEIQTDLNLLNASIPKEADHQFSDPLVNALAGFDPSAAVTRINDMAVNDGHIFDKNGGNLYDSIFVLHDEYVTQQEYFNYEKFVRNGGNLVLLDGNIFYVEVKYDEASCTVHFLKGHDWEFDGMGMHKGVSERFADENKKFIGSNFVVNDIRDPETYSNNPFNYTHFEENYLNNNNATIFIDYGAKIPKSSSTNENANPNASPSSGGGNGFVPGDLLGQVLGGGNNDESKTIATYQLEPFGSQAGKVIMMGLYGQNLLHNQKFLGYLNNVIFPLAAGDSKTISAGQDGQTFPVHIKVPARYSAGSMAVDVNSTSIKFRIAPVKNYVSIDSKDTTLIAVFPKSLIDDGNATGSSKFTVTIDGVPTKYSFAKDNVQTGISVNLSGNQNAAASSALYPHNVSYIGTQVLPEFNPAGMLPQLGAVIAVVISVQHLVRNRLRSKANTK